MILGEKIMHFWKKDIARAGENQESFDGSIYLPKQKEITEEILSFQEKLPIVIKGCALGDYAGQPYEFSLLSDCRDMPRSMIYKKSLDCTDDTILTCATAKVLLYGKYDYEDAYRKYAKKYNHPLGGYGARFLAWVYSGIDPNSCGNGSAMRVGPCGCLSNVEDVINEAYKSAVCTHSHPEGIKGAIVIAVCIWMAFHDYTKKEIGEYVDKFYPNSPYAPKVSWKKMTSYEKIKGNPAVCQTTVPMAVSCFVNSNTFEDCIWKAVQFGWDADTQAAIAGSIAGTYYMMHCLFSDDSNNAWKTLKENKYIKEIIT